MALGNGEGGLISKLHNVDLFQYSADADAQGVGSCIVDHATNVNSYEKSVISL